MKPVPVFLVVSCAFAATLFADIQWSSDYAMHTDFNKRFLESKGNGISRMYADTMQVHDSMRLRITSADIYKLEAVELVGVRVRVLEPEPLDDRRTPATPRDSRPPTACAPRPLREPKACETVSVQVEKSGRFVVGALRAKQDCVQCHAGYKTGDLLGALSYRLTRGQE